MKSVEELINSLEERRVKYEEISNSVKTVADELSNKVLPALRISRSLPNTANISLVIQSLGQLYKTQLDAEEKIVKSIEKQCEIVSKLGGNPLNDEEITAEKVREIAEAIKKGQN